MLNNEIILEFLKEGVKLLISGILGGAVGSIISLKVFREQKKFEAKQQILYRKLEALREMIVLFHWVHRDIIVNWEQPMDFKVTPQEHIANLIDQVNRWKTLFLDDSQVSQALQRIYTLIGASKGTFYGIDKEGDLPSEILSEVRETLEEKIKEIEKTLLNS